MKKIGYLVPEFPAQTHNFFWREIGALKELGVEVELFSTRLPAPRIQSPSWAKEAKARTTYIFPVSLKDSLLAGFSLVVAGPSRIAKCASVAFGAQGLKPRGRMRMLGMVLLGAHLGRLARQRGITHVHVHSCADAANIALFSNLASGLTYSMTLHNPLSIWGPNQPAKWGHASFGVVIAQWILADLKARLPGNLPDRLVIAPMGVNTATFRRTAPYQPYQSEGALRLFSCARLNRCKGFVYLLEAVRLLRAEGLPVELTIAGQDEQGGSGYRLELESLVQKLGISDRVRFLGAVSEEDVRQNLSAAHVFVLASLEEPLGVAIMEAMAMETPVIATNAGGVPELISDGREGLLVAPESANEIVEAVRKLSSQPLLSLALVRAARQRVEQGFSHRASAQRIADEVDRMGVAAVAR